MRGYRTLEEEMDDAARRRLQAMSLSVGAGVEETKQESQVAGDGQLRGYSRSVALAARHPVASLPAPLPLQPTRGFAFPSFQHSSATSMLASSLPSLQQQPFSLNLPSSLTTGGGLARNEDAQAQVPEVARLPQENRLLAIERAQMEVRVHAQARAQAQARVQALIDHELQSIRQLQFLRQRQHYDELLLTSPLGGAGRTQSLGDGSPGGALQHQSQSSPDFAVATSVASAPTAPARQSHSALSGDAATNLRNEIGAVKDTSFAGKILPSEPGRAASRVPQARPPSHAKISLGMTRSQGYASKKCKEEEEEELGEDDEDDDHADDGSNDEEADLSDDEFFRRNPPDTKSKHPGVKRRREIFTIKLYRMLYEAEKNGQADIISFSPHGRSFAVHQSKEFIATIMPKYWSQGRMNTFLKQLNLYGFKRITQGKDKGGYFHPLFMKGKRHLCKQIKRAKKATKAKPGASVQLRRKTSESPSDLTQLFDGTSALSPRRNKKNPR